VCDRLKLSATDEVMSDDTIDDGGGEATLELARACRDAQVTVPILKGAE
jgi:hypothetical protein